MLLHCRWVHFLWSRISNYKISLYKVHWSKQRHIVHGVVCLGLRRNQLLTVSYSSGIPYIFLYKDACNLGIKHTLLILDSTVTRINEDSKTNFKDLSEIKFPFLATSFKTFNFDLYTLFHYSSKLWFLKCWYVSEISILTCHSLRMYISKYVSVMFSKFNVSESAKQQYRLGHWCYGLRARLESGRS